METGRMQAPSLLSRSRMREFIRKACIDHPSRVRPAETSKWARGLTQRRILGYDAPAKRVVWVRGHRVG